MGKTSKARGLAARLDDPALLSIVDEEAAKIRDDIDAISTTAPGVIQNNEVAVGLALLIVSDLFCHSRKHGELLRRLYGWDEYLAGYE